MKTWFTKEFLKAAAVLLIVFLAGAGAGYVGGHKYAEYKFHKEFMSRAFESRTGAAEPAASVARSLRSKSLERDARFRRAEAAERSVRRVRSAHSKRAKSERRRSRGEKRFMRRLERDLNLNPAQRENVDRALERHYARIRDIRRSMRPQISSIMQEIRRDVRSFLDDEQKTSFDDMVKKFEERRKRRWRKYRKQHKDDPAGQSKKQ